jgi:hypothetical protein
MRFVGIARPKEFRSVTRAHVIPWRKDLERGSLSGAKSWHKLAASVSNSLTKSTRRFIPRVHGNKELIGLVQLFRTNVS